MSNHASTEYYVHLAKYMWDELRKPYLKYIIMEHLLKLK